MYNSMTVFYSGENGRIIYSLEEGSLFTLEQYEDQAGRHLDLIPAADLDKEKVDSIDINLIASNPNSEGESSSLPIHITILDQNEFKPTFDKTVNVIYDEILRFVINRIYSRIEHLLGLAPVSAGLGMARQAVLGRARGAANDGLGFLVWASKWFILFI